MQKILEWLGMGGALEHWSEIREAFIVVVALGWILPIGIVFVLWMVFRRRRTCRGLVVPAEKGDLYVSINAIREFVSGILAEFSDVSLRSVELRNRRSMLTFLIEVDVVPRTDLVALRERIKDRIFQEAQEKIGIHERLEKVNVSVRGWDANEMKIAKRAKRSQVKQAELPVPESNSTE